MNENELVEKIMKKKEFSRLPIDDVRFVLSKFDSCEYLDEERIKFTRDLLQKVYSSFVSSKLFSLQDKDCEWRLKKHLSTKERLPFYEEVYSKVLKDFFKKELDFKLTSSLSLSKLPTSSLNPLPPEVKLRKKSSVGCSSKNISVIDLGAGINGFSYFYFEKLGYNVDYLAIEAVGQLVDLMNKFSLKNKLNAKAVHLSLFDLQNIKKEIKKMKKPKVVFLFKIIDGLEMLKRDYSKELLFEIVPLAQRVVISFATKSMISRKKIFVKRNWIVNFIKDNFKLLDDFVVGAERYIVFEKK